MLAWMEHIIIMVRKPTQIKSAVLEIRVTRFQVVTPNYRDSYEYHIFFFANSGFPGFYRGLVLSIY